MLFDLAKLPLLTLLHALPQAVVSQHLDSHKMQLSSAVSKLHTAFLDVPQVLVTLTGSGKIQNGLFNTGCALSAHMTSTS